MGGPEGGRKTRMAMLWITQESGAGELHVDMRAGGGNTGKAPSVAVDESGVRGRHRARPAQRGQKGGWKENKAVETSGVRGDDRGLEASGVAHDSP